MQFPINYPLALTALKCTLKFPNVVIGTNLHYTSLRTDEYNCAAWAIGITDDWIQFKGRYDTEVSTYISYFKEKGFVIDENNTLQEGFIKIAIYLEGNEFKHVARQLANGKWTSKIGDWEDVEHDTLQVLFGDFYGTQVIILKKQISD